MMLANPDEIFARYVSGKIVALKTVDTSRCETDKRYTYLLDTDLGEHIAIKLCNNSFTTPERIRGWRRLAELYNRLGIYAPRIISDRDGNICSKHAEGREQYIAYAEEQKKYQTTDEFGLAPDDFSLYFEDMVKAAARVARHSKQLPDWKSAWCLYDVFCAEDETDETYYWQKEFYKLVVTEMPMFSERAERIWGRFLESYRSFESPYRSLPQAFFQGDEGGSNVMLDENKRFVGVLDFNLAGAETIMNYFFREFCCVRIDKNEISRLNARELLERKDREMRARLDVVKKYYRFSRAEAAAFPMYYRVVYPLACDLCQTFQSVVRQKEPRALERVLDWIEYQQTRSDVSL